MTSLDFLHPELERLAARGLLRTEEPGADADAAIACSNDYLGLASGALAAPPRSSRPGAGASRLVYGTHPEHLDLERELAGWHETETCLLFSSGYAANVGVVGAFGVVPQITLFSDALNHASLIDGCRLSGAKVEVFPHRDLAALGHGLRRATGPKLVLTESYFSMDGTSPDLSGLAALCADQGAALLVDEAHALGVFGPEGRGLCSTFGVQPDILVGTLGKAIGTQGAFVAGSALLRAWLWNRARSFVYSTALSPALAVASIHHLRAVRAADALRDRLRSHCTRFAELLQQFHVKLAPDRHGPIFPVTVGEESRALELRDRLRARGFLVQAIRPPTVPPGTSRIRITLSATMEPMLVEALAVAIGEELSRPS